MVRIMSTLLWDDKSWYKVHYQYMSSSVLNLQNNSKFSTHLKKVPVTKLSWMFSLSWVDLGIFHLCGLRTRSRRLNLHMGWIKTQAMQANFIWVLDSHSRAEGTCDIKWVIKIQASKLYSVWKLKSPWTCEIHSFQKCNLYKLI